jgi:hypothetical protein
VVVPERTPVEASKDKPDPSIVYTLPDNVNAEVEPVLTSSYSFVIKGSGSSPANVVITVEIVELTLDPSA